MRLELHAGPEGVYLASLALNREPGWPGQGFSGNLLPGKADTDSVAQRHGHSGGRSRAGMAAACRIPPKLRPGPAGCAVEGIELGPAERPLAREEWSLELGAGGLRWRITRTFLEACRLTADRFPALVLSTQAGRGRYSEIAGLSGYGNAAGRNQRLSRRDGARNGMRWSRPAANRAFTLRHRI